MAKSIKIKAKENEPVFSYTAPRNERMTVRITSGDSFIRLTNRMLFVEDGQVNVTGEEYEQLRAMKVC